MMAQPLFLYQRTMRKERACMAEVKQSEASCQEHGRKIPNHVAIILDGNGRWAKSKGMPRNYGHVQGAKNVETIL